MIRHPTRLVSEDKFVTRRVSEDNFATERGPLNKHAHSPATGLGVALKTVRSAAAATSRIDNPAGTKTPAKTVRNSQRNLYRAFCHGTLIRTDESPSLGGFHKRRDNNNLDLPTSSEHCLPI